MSKTLCIAGGGTGGHVMPALAWADMARQHFVIDVLFIGAERGLEATLLPQRGETPLLLRMHAIQGASRWQQLRVLAWELPRAILKILWSWRKNKPRLVIGVGGYASAAAVFAAVLARVPVILHEQNAIPGMVTRKLAPFCNILLLGFKQSQEYLPNKVKTLVTGNPVRKDVQSVSWQQHSPPCLLIMGGSQGARVFNQLAPQACGLLYAKGMRFNVLHLSGRGNDELVRDIYLKLGVSAEVLPFCPNIADYYAKADILLSRAGAMSVCEIAKVGIPSVFVPYPYAADAHQHHNAKAMQDASAAILLEEQALDAEKLAETLELLLLDSEKLAQMHDQAKRVFPDDCEKIVLPLLASYLS
ncbi:MAG: undecaprenyldiphospho-muramoylpentapeptide beta-N-acetylglucosaminyltransferase [Mariprofundales bacterium]